MKINRQVLTTTGTASRKEMKLNIFSMGIIAQMPKLRSDDFQLSAVTKATLCCR